MGDDIGLDGERRGLDIVKALARGLTPLQSVEPVYLVWLQGFDGVDKALTLLSGDVHLAMGLLAAASGRAQAKGTRFACDERPTWSSELGPYGMFCHYDKSGQRRWVGPVVDSDASRCQQREADGTWLNARALRSLQ